MKPELSGLISMLKAEGFIKSARVEEAMGKVDRAHFVTSDSAAYAYEDLALPIGNGQTISAPSVVAFMLEALDIKEGMKILEVGTGSGYNCALLSVLAGARGKVISIDSVPELVQKAKENMTKAGLGRKQDTQNWKLATGDGSCGVEKEAPYDRIIVTAAMPQFDKDHPLAKQLTGNGKLVAPVGSSFGQDLVLFDNKTKSMQAILPVIFVPLIGECGV